MYRCCSIKAWMFMCCHFCVLLIYSNLILLHFPIIVRTPTKHSQSMGEICFNVWFLDRCILFHVIVRYLFLIWFGDEYYTFLFFQLPLCMPNILSRMILQMMSTSHYQKTGERYNPSLLSYKWCGVSQTVKIQTHVNWFSTFS